MFGKKPKPTKKMFGKTFYWCCLISLLRLCRDGDFLVKIAGLSIASKAKEEVMTSLQVGGFRFSMYVGTFNMLACCHRRGVTHSLASGERKIDVRALDQFSTKMQPETERSIANPTSFYSRHMQPLALKMSRF
jgi:hypothetical protein